ncbi:sensor histidine kinase [Tistrella bauzanensis]
MPVDAADARVMADRVRLEQVLVNLIGNALDAVADGPEPRISISLRRAKGRIALAVADNGPGLPLEIRAGLFLPFRTTKPDGLGLGLVISADLVREMGGTLTAGPPATDDGSPGRGGAQFILDLPEVS